MSLDYHSGSKLQTNTIKYTNDVILKEIRSLVKQEKYILETENDQLKRNNDDLANRIQDLYNDFDTTRRTYKNKSEKFVDAKGRIKNLEKKSKSSRKKNNDLVKDKYDQRSVLNDLRSQLVSSQDSLSMMKLHIQESDAGFEIKNKEIEILESRNSGLVSQIQEIENNNKSLQKECKIMSKSMRHARETTRNYIKHMDIGLSVSIEDKNDSHSILLKPEIKSSGNTSPILTPTYIDIFDNKIKADLYSKGKRHHLDKPGIEQFFVNDPQRDDVPKLNHLFGESEISPIYADINSMKRHKFTSTESLKEQTFESKLDNQQHQFRPDKQSQDNCNLLKKTTEEIVKISAEHQQIINLLQKHSTVLDSLQQTKMTDSWNFPQYNEKFNGNVKQSKNRDENGDLLKKTSEDIEKISEAEQQILDLLIKNSSVLDHLQQTKMADSNPYSFENIKELKNKSYQTDRDKDMAIKEVIMSKTNNNDILKLINDQNHKIQDLSDKFSLIQSHNPPKTNIDSMKPFGADFHEHGKDRKDMLSESSFEDISNITELAQSNSDKAVAASLAIVNESKSVSSIILSASEYQPTLNSERPINMIGHHTDSIDNIDNSDNFLFESQSDTLPSPERIIEKVVENVGTEPHVANRMPFLSKIPKLITSRSLEFTRESDGGKSIFSNDLESSYETLYDPVSSARFEKENTTPL